jgi:hypothetical protein
MEINLTPRILRTFVNVTFKCPTMSAPGVNLRVFPGCRTLKVLNDDVFE